MSDRTLYSSLAREALCMALLKPEYSDFNATAFVMSFDVPDDEIWFIDENGIKSIYKVDPTERTWHHLRPAEREVPHDKQDAPAAAEDGE